MEVEVKKIESIKSLRDVLEKNENEEDINKEIVIRRDIESENE